MFGEQKETNVDLVVMSPLKDVATTFAASKNSTMSTQSQAEDEGEDDAISKAIGEYGRWQLQLTFLLSLFNFPCTFHIYSPTFQAAYRNYWCARPSHLSSVSPETWRNYSQPYDCQILNLDWSSVSLQDVQSGRPPPNATTIPCDRWEWDNTNIGQTVVSEWNLVCERGYLNNVAEMTFLAGVALGGMVGGVLSDKFGRKKTLMSALVLQTTIGVSISFAPWLELYLILRAALGFISVAVVFSGFVLAIELVGGKWRTVAGVSNLFPLSLAYVTISGIAWLVRDWRQLQLAISLPGLLLCGLWWVLPESPRWLLAMGRKAEVLAILGDAALVNHRELPDNIDKMLQPPLAEERKSAGILDLFRTSNMRKTTLCLFAIWFTVYLVYYGLVLNVSNIGGDIYVNSVLAGLVEIPAIAVSILFLLKLGRRWPLCCTLVLSGTACLATLLVPPNHKYQWARTTFAMIGKFSVSSSNAVLPVFTAELFPTVIRNVGVGASNMSAGVALMLVPYLWMLATIDTAIPMGLLGAFGIGGGLCVLFLPETGNRPLARTVQEQERRPGITTGSVINCNGGSFTNISA